jgi:subtilisin family serine protease
LIYSTFPGGRYEALSGTSQATAFATGAAALLLSANPKETPVEVIRKLASTGLPNHYLIGKTKYQVQLNSFRALAMKDESESAEGVQVENKRLFSQLAFSSTSMRKVIPSPSPNLGNRKKRTKIALKE